MNKEKTAMQMLIEDLEKHYSSINIFKNPELKSTKRSIGHGISIAKNLLKKEQEQIEKAFDDGYQGAEYHSEISISQADETCCSNKYYQSKYGGEE